MTELINEGVTKMRLPNWRVAYAVPRSEGPWADVFDVEAGIGSGDPIPVLIGQCNGYHTWEPVDKEAGNG